MSQQHSHNTTPFTAAQFPIHLLCDGMQSPANMGSLFRVADAFGVEKIIFGGASVAIESARLKRTSRNTHSKVPYSEVDKLQAALLQLKQQGFTVVALEITETSIPLQQFVPLAQQKLAIVLGNEKNGISSEILDSCDHHLHIEMYGKNSSMNVVQAASIALYALTKH